MRSIFIFLVISNVLIISYVYLYKFPRVDSPVPGQSFDYPLPLKSHLKVAHTLSKACAESRPTQSYNHDDVIKWNHFPRNWPFVGEIHRSPGNFPHKGQWRGALMFSLIYAWINDWVNNREAGDLRRQHGHYDVIVMKTPRSANHGRG